MSYFVLAVYHFNAVAFFMRHAVALEKMPSIWQTNPGLVGAALVLVLFLFVITGVGAWRFVFIARYRSRQMPVSQTSALHPADDPLERIIKTAPLAFLIAVDDKIVELNESMQRFSGMAVGNLLQNAFADINEYHALIERIHRGETVQNFLARLRLRNGTVRRCLINPTTAEYAAKTAMAIWVLDIEENEADVDMMRVTQESLQSVLDAMPVPVRIVEMQTEKVIYMNNACLTLFEFDTDAWQGMRLSEMLPEYQSNGTSSKEKVARIRHTDTPFSMEVEYQTGKGHIIETLLHARHINYYGQIVSIGIIQDFADVKAVRAARESLQLVLNAMPVPIQIVELETDKILYMNNSYVSFFAFESHIEGYGKTFIDMLPVYQNDGVLSTEKVKRIKSTSEPFSMELAYLNAHGRVIETMLNACHIIYEGQMVSIGIIKDLTAEKEQQRMLINTAEKEKEANELKSRFLVNMSHEIRTPMNAIIGLTEIELHKALSRDVEDIYRKINTSAKNLLTIINDILDLSKIEADKIELYEDEIELEEVLSSAILVAQPRLENKQVEFILNAAHTLPKYIRGDRTRLWQILKNCLDNSAKYTDQGQIVLTVYEDTDRSDEAYVQLMFLVEDTGIGMTEAQIARVFTPYIQIYNEAQKKYTGTGLGMAITKQLCELMEGTLRIESEYGQGTIICLSIPFKRSQASELTTVLERTDELAPYHIMVVDDDVLSLSVASELLIKMGACCETARNGEEALASVIAHRARGKAFDLILLDYKMEGMDGLETARRIQTSLSKAPKLLMVTAYQQLLLKEKNYLDYIEDVVEKPLIPSRFAQKVRAAFGLVAETVSEKAKYTKFTNAHVLLCEDYSLNSEVATGMFKQFGVTATVAENGQEGVALLQAGHVYDMIFMDLQMPVMNGYEASRIIRSDPRFDKIPIISLTADAMKEVVDACAAAGMDDYIAKPIDFGRLHEVFLKWLPECKREAMVAEMPTDTEAMARFSNRVMYVAALRAFAKDLPDDWPDFNTAVADRVQTKAFIHKIKGASGTLDEADLYQNAVGFEASLRDGSPDAVVYEALVAASAAFKARVAAMQEEAADTPKGTEAEFALLTETLATALADYDMNTIMTATQQLHAKRWPGVDEAALERIYAYVREFDYDSALETLGLYPWGSAVMGVGG